MSVVCAIGECDVCSWWVCCVLLVSVMCAVGECDVYCW